MQVSLLGFPNGLLGGETTETYIVDTVPKLATGTPGEVSQWAWEGSS